MRTREIACQALAPLALEHELVDLARQRPAGRAARAPGLGVHGGRPLPARRPRRADRGHDRLHHPAGARQRAAARQAARVAADARRGRRDRSGVRESDEADRPDLHRGRGRRPRRGEGLDVQARRRQLPPRRPLADAAAHLRARAARVAARAGTRRRSAPAAAASRHVRRRARRRRAGGSSASRR